MRSLPPSHEPVAHTGHFNPWGVRLFFHGPFQDRFRSGLISALLAAALLGWPGPVSGQTHTWKAAPADNDWFNGANWDGDGNCPGPGAEALIGAGASVMLTNETAELASLTMTGGTLTFSNWMTRVRAVEVLLATGAVFTLPAPFTTNADVMSNRVWIACSNLTIAAGATVQTLGRGYVKGQGPGNSGGTRGGSHGGRGSVCNSGWSVYRQPYGELAEPTAPGSGGSGGTLANTGDGGGAIRVDATGQVVLDGTLNANGMNAISTHGGGGSGGSILIGCRTFTGSGRLSVRGGNGNNSGGAGGGGRIAVLYVPAAQAGMAPVNSGVKFNAAPGINGLAAYTAEPGTLYFPDTAFISASMSTQWEEGSLHIPGFTDWSADNLQIAGKLGLPDVTNLLVTNDLSILAGGALTLYSAPTNDTTPPDGLVLGVGGALSVAGTLVLASDPTNGGSPRVTCRDLTVAATGRMDADGRGFAVRQGPGAIGRGAGHGGMGSCGGSAYTARGPVYGDPLLPTAPGSGSGDATYAHLSGYGGGALRLHVAETATIHGVLSANGQTAFSTHGNAGSGGSILLACRIFQGSGTGLLQARGGNGDNTGGAAGGGRLAVLYNAADQAALPSPNPGVRFSAAPGSLGNNDFLAESGSLYLPDAETLFLSSHMTAQWQDVNLVIPGGFPTWSLPSLQLDGKFRIPGLETMQVAGDLILASGGRLVLYSQPSNTVEHEIGARLDVGGALTVPSGAEILLVSDLDTGGVPYIECGSFDLQAGGLVRADYRGFHIGQGPGRGVTYGGGGYGGAGSRGASPVGSGGPVNGAAHAPVLAGSAAGTYATGGGRGGGSVRISARGAMAINGTIQANGMMRIVTHSGGGAGGGILLTARSFSGAGSLQARGGNSTNNGGAGGGGRIAIWTSFLPPGALRRLAGQDLPGRVVVLEPATLWPALTLSVAAGTGGTNPAEAAPGTVFAGCLDAGTFVIIR